MNGNEFNSFLIRFSDQKIYLLLTHISLCLFLFTIGLSRVYIGVHSFNQILLGWCYGIIVLVLYLKHFKKRSHRILKIQAF